MVGKGRRREMKEENIKKSKGMRKEEGKIIEEEKGETMASCLSCPAIPD